MVKLYIFLAVSALVLCAVIAFSVLNKRNAAKGNGAAKKKNKRRAAKKKQVVSGRKVKPAAEKIKLSEEVEPASEEAAVAPYDIGRAAVADEVGDETDDEGENVAEEQTERKLVVENGEVKYIIIKYSKSFQAKLIQSGEETKNYYSQLKNCLLSYSGVKSRMSWRWETFRSGRKALAKLRMRGKTLSVALALNPDDYADSKYIVESLADVAAYADTQCLYKIKNDRRAKYAAELIDVLMRVHGLPAGSVAENVDYASRYPYETTEALIERKLIKELTDEEAQSGTVFKPSDVRKSVTAAEVDGIMHDEVAEILIEKAEEVSDRTKVGIVNIDALSRVFADGETVTLEEVKKRVKGFDRRVTYLKVLARGALDKKLTVKADAFSLQAAKMILLTGGKVIKK